MPTEFDAYADRYDEALERGLALTGEDKHYFAAERLAWTRRGLARLGVTPRVVLDYGCGTGTAIPLLAASWALERIVGVDPSAQSLERARADHPRPNVVFVALDSYQPRGDCDLVFTNGVFHHIPAAERAGTAQLIAASLRPGGAVAFWENNPWNPGARWVMSRVPFDRDAVMVSPPEARRLLRGAGLRVISTSFRFVFPRALGWLRGLEPGLARIPLGGQYLVIAQRATG